MDGKPRGFFVGGNIKMNGNKQSLMKIVQNINDAKLDPSVEVVIAPPAVYLSFVRENLRKDVQVAAQNVFDQPDGAYTGETSVSQLADLSVHWTILGHSERRAMGETDAIVASKTKHAVDGGLSVIWCCGESLDQREASRTINVITTQLQALKDAGFTQWSRITIAYEPIWAIGTGKVATPEQAQEVHQAIRGWLSREVSDQAAKTRVIYGGSVSEKNCRELCAKPDIDGFLVGGASLKPGFIDIINCNHA